eukprot:m.196338 g.196338  ORF g.196338 m.196338 type:complete len:287 (-) comp10629_c0_seq7:2898-3758(-)
MMRKQARERREFLFRKAREQQERATHEKKRILREALQAGRKIPTELRSEEAALRREIAMDDANAHEFKDSRDDEYRWAGVEDPKILITTSRDPSSRLKQFAKEMKLVIPGSARMNRGNHVIKDLVQVCRSNDVTDLVVLHEHRGEPDGMVVCHLPYGPTAYFNLSNVVMRHDIPDAGTMSEAFPHLIFHNFSTPLGERIKSILKFIFPVPKDDSRRVCTFANKDDFISFRHHVYKQNGKDIDLSEIGPRFEMKPYMIRLGTADQVDADIEWVSRPFMNTAKKRRFL